MDTQPPQAPAHERTLMRPTMGEWLRLDDPMLGHNRVIRCQECGRSEEVDHGWLLRGEYFCEGGGTWGYERHVPGRPSMTELVFGPGAFQGAALDDVIEIHNQLARLDKELHAMLERLEMMIYLYGKPEGS